MMHTLCQRSFAFWLLLGCINAAAQVPIKLDTEDAKPLTFIAQGIEISRMTTSDKSVSRVVMQRDVTSKTTTLTEVTQDTKGVLQQLKVSIVTPSSLRPLGEYGSRIESEDNEYFGGKVHVVVLVCAGTNVACITEQDINTEDGQAAKSTSATYFKAHFRTRLEAERILAQIIAF